MFLIKMSLPTQIQCIGASIILLCVMMIYVIQMMKKLSWSLRGETWLISEQEL